MKKNMEWGILFVVVCAVFCGCVVPQKPVEKPDDDYDIDEIVAELVESTKHHANQPNEDKPKDAENNIDPNQQKPLTDEKVADGEKSVSPFGFGPYPEIPADFPDQDIFHPNKYGQAAKENPNYELMDRVRLELWKRGVRGIEGMSISGNTGLVTPTIQGIAYADWEPRWGFFGIGFGKRYTGLSGHPDDFGALGLDGIEIPKGVKVFHSSKAIDPYLLLKIPKEK